MSSDTESDSDDEARPRYALSVGGQSVLCTDDSSFQSAISVLREVSSFASAHADVNYVVVQLEQRLGKSKTKALAGKRLSVSISFDKTAVIGSSAVDAKAMVEHLQLDKAEIAHGKGGAVEIRVRIAQGAEELVARRQNPLAGRRCQENELVQPCLHADTPDQQGPHLGALTLRPDP